MTFFSKYLALDDLSTKSNVYEVKSQSSSQSNSETVITVEKK